MCQRPSLGHPDAFVATDSRRLSVALVEEETPFSRAAERRPVAVIGVRNERGCFYGRFSAVSSQESSTGRHSFFLDEPSSTRASCGSEFCSLPKRRKISGRGGENQHRRFVWLIRGVPTRTLSGVKGNFLTVFLELNERTHIPSVCYDETDS